MTERKFLIWSFIRFVVCAVSIHTNTSATVKPENNAICVAYRNYRKSFSLIFFCRLTDKQVLGNWKLWNCHRVVWTVDIDSLLNRLFESEKIIQDDSFSSNCQSSGEGNEFFAIFIDILCMCQKMCIFLFVMKMMMFALNCLFFNSVSAMKLKQRKSIVWFSHIRQLISIFLILLEQKKNNCRWHPMTKIFGLWLQMI